MGNKWRRNIWIICLLNFLFISGNCDAQKKDVNYKIDKGDIIISFKNYTDKHIIDSLLRLVGSSKKLTDSLYNTGLKGSTPLGWKCIYIDKDEIVYKKPISKLEYDIKEGSDQLEFIDKIEIRKKIYDLKYDEQIDDFLFGSNKKNKLPYDLDVSYGHNFPNLNSVEIDENNVVTFRLFSRSKAKKVYLAGTFNNWSTLNTPMIKRNGIWEKRVKLKWGKHLYKFIVDGKWMTDPINQNRERDREGNMNSVYFVNNYFFYLDGYQDAKKVYLSGSFNDWKEKELEFKKKEGRWIFPLYLAEGTHFYKFIVDGKWIVDPANRTIKQDAHGNENSYLAFGNQYEFKLRHFLDAKQVILTGDFNGWNRVELKMEFQDSLWVLPYFLKSGNYKYKYIVDGKWNADPENPHTSGKRKLKNSVIAVNPNHTFILKGFPNAKEIILTGTFNDWSEKGYTMERVGDYWEIKLHMPTGKTLYKFIIDGRWITDPDNPLWEYNQYATKNSILWLDQ